ncbi:hypothetical protein [Reyranella sp. CPCC 100927]|uniref:hypothetical protein n=1 Tax=Reyranella sp. CPCC 100927 TaxID=2599616 RepID=UPI0011B363E6|nr:hypothetical protein [Reyranella sp. CPCC 100927]TWT11689.1 hypothetical protein FQU96_14535 [Reyranella sp. CPCC 100927]
MADQKLSQLAAREATVGDPFNDLLYYVVAEGATGADKQRKTTPFDLLIGCFRRMSFFFADFHSFTDMNTFGRIETSNQVDTSHQGVVEVRITNVDDVGGVWGVYRGVNMGDGALRFVACVKIGDDLSTPTDRYQALVGMPMEGDAQADQAGIYLRYSDDVNGGKWQLVTGNVNSGTTVVDTGVLVEAATWYRIQIDVAADLSSCSASVNGSVPVAATTNVHDRDATLGINARKITGTDERRLIIDYLAFVKHLATAR